MTAQKLLSTVGFYALVVVIVVFSVFPFYYAIVTSFATGTELFKVNYLPKSFDWGNYQSVLGGRNFVRSIINSVFIATTTVVFALFLAVTASYALARVRFRGRGLLLMAILAVSMFPQIAVLAGLFELIRFLGIFNTPWAMILSYVIFTLPFTVWVLTTFMRDLPVEIEEAAIVDGATPWVIITKVFLPLLWPALVTTGLLAFIGAWKQFRDDPDGAGGDRAPLGREPAGNPLGSDHGGQRHRDGAADHPRPHFPTQDRRGSDRGRREGLTSWQRSN
jgi:trehalose/maltose transport system permease protein